MIRLLRQADFRTVPWANGAGVTVEMWREDRAGKLWRRLSRAAVVQDGPFSRFEGVERNLTVLTGPGFRLVGTGVDLAARPLTPVAFSGDVAIRAEGVTAPSEDFNVMTARAAGLPLVQVMQGGRLADGAIFAVGAVTIAGRSLAPFDLILSDEAVDFDGLAIVVRFAG